MQQKNNNHSAKKIVCSIFFSLFAGIFIGFLFAPKSGLKLREDLRNWIGEIVERGKFTIEEVKVYGSEFIDRSLEKVESFSLKMKNNTTD
jgi:hypothetical protein